MTIPSTLASIAIFLASIAIGVGGLFVTAYVFDTMKWCCFHSWALMHASGSVTFLLSAYLGFHIMRRLVQAQGQFSLVPNSAFICSALGTLIFTEFFMWPGVLLSGFGVYRRVRHGDTADAGLMWSAVFVSVLNFAYWLYLTILIATM